MLLHEFSHPAEDKLANLSIVLVNTPHYREAVNLSHFMRCMGLRELWKASGLCVSGVSVFSNQSFKIMNSSYSLLCRDCWLLLIEVLHLWRAWLLRLLFSCLQSLTAAQSTDKMCPSTKISELNKLTFLCSLKINLQNKYKSKAKYKHI